MTTENTSSVWRRGCTRDVCRSVRSRRYYAVANICLTPAVVFGVCFLRLSVAFTCMPAIEYWRNCVSLIHRCVRASGRDHKADQHVSLALACLFCLLLYMCWIIFRLNTKVGTALFGVAMQCWVQTVAGQHISLVLTSLLWFFWSVSQW